MGGGGGRWWWEVVVVGGGGGRWWWEVVVGGGGGRWWVTCGEPGVSQWKDGNLWCTSIVSRQIQSRHHEFGS